MKINDCPICKASPKDTSNNKPMYQKHEAKILGNHYIRCGNCGLSGPFGDSKTSAIIKWNLLKI